MAEQDSVLFGGKLAGGQQALDLVARLFRVAEPGAVYAAPVTQGDRTVILLSELNMSVGAGYGGGTDGGGGGGGGFSAGRPVAAVVIEPGGVHVEPVVDATKLGIAFITALAAMYLAWSRMRRALRTGKP